jgi:hypothetical protein
MTCRLSPSRELRPLEELAQRCRARRERSPSARLELAQQQPRGAARAPQLAAAERVPGAFQAQEGSLELEPLELEPLELERRARARALERRNPMPVLKLARPA